MGKWCAVWLGLCNSVWFGISGKLRGREEMVGSGTIGTVPDRD